MIDFSAISWLDLAPFVAIGFLAQLVDGTVGMGFGVMTNSLLVALGLPGPAASAAVRTAESFTSGISGLSHAFQRNLDWSLFGRLVIPGIAGGFIGVWIFTHVGIPVMRPVVLVYLAAVGCYLLWRGPRRPQTFRRTRLVGTVGFLGGILDASGGGGWGPIVTGNLLSQGANPRSVIGTANAAEFFVTVTVLATFIGTLGLQSVTVAAAGLIIGGVVAAPIGAILVKRLAPRTLIVCVGGALVAIALFGLLALIFSPIPTFPRF
jgi:uncharacterized membrane protein YfcA